MALVEPNLPHRCHPCWVAASSVSSARTRATDTAAPHSHDLYHWYLSTVSHEQRARECGGASGEGRRWDAPSPIGAGFAEDELLAADTLDEAESEKFRAEWATFLKHQREEFALLLQRWGKFGKGVKTSVTNCLSDSDSNYHVPTVQPGSRASLAPMSARRAPSPRQRLQVVELEEHDDIEVPELGEPDEVPPIQASVCSSRESSARRAHNGTPETSHSWRPPRSDSRSEFGSDSNLEWQHECHPISISDLGTARSTILSTSRTNVTELGMDWNPGLITGSRGTPSCGDSNSANSSASGRTRQRLKFCSEIFPPPKSNKARLEKLEEQDSYCKGCLQPLTTEETSVGVFSSLISGEAAEKVRFCHYTGLLFCSDCHKNKKAQLPSKMVHEWDFKRYPVSSDAYQYITHTYHKPTVCVSALRPTLFEQCVPLQVARRLRVQLVLMYNVVKECERFNSNAYVIHKYYMEGTELWSMYDLQRMFDTHPKLDSQLGEDMPPAEDWDGRVDPACGKNALILNLKQLRQKLFDHVMRSCRKNCYVKALQFCNICCNQKPLFSFDINNTFTCPRCDSVYHKTCFKSSGCPECEGV